MTTNDTAPAVRAVARGVEAADRGPTPARSARLDALEVFVGRWINEGETITTDGSAGLRIVTSDVYEWAPGRHHIVHAAFGQLAGVDVGGTEIITLDADTDRFRTYFFDSQGTTSTHDLTVDGDTWTWQGESTRCTVRLSDDGRVQDARHERTDDGGATWLPSMRVTLTRID